METTQWSLRRGLAPVVLILSGLLLDPGAAQANDTFNSAFRTRYASTPQTYANAGCNTCHAGTFNRTSLNLYGQAVQSANGDLAALEGLDSDGVGGPNLAEIEAGAQPGWCAASGCATPPAGVQPPFDPAAPNKPPVADAGGPYSGTVGSPVGFDGSGSSDSDGTIEGYAWDFGDGSTGVGVNPVNTYGSAGTFTVVLTVTDDGGATAQSSTTVTVSVGLQPPVADAGGPYSGTAGVAIEFDGSGSADPDGSVVSWAWDFGDGSTGEGATPVHTYAASGAFTVTLTVTDDDGLTDGASTTARVSDGSGMQPPVAEVGGPYPGTTGLPVSFDGSASWDPDGTIVSFEWDFGDGNVASGSTPTHTYDAAGLYTVALTVTDETGLTDTATTTADIIDAINQPPVADPGGPYSGEPGAPVQFDGSGSSDPDGNVMSYAWDFGDGATRSGATAADATPSHGYALAGEYTVTLRVTDDSGTQSAPVGTTVSIRAADGGEALYSANCAGCHGDPWDGPAVDAALPGLKRVTGARACTIEGAIFGTSVFPDGVPAMVSAGNQELTLEEIGAIAAYLNSHAANGEQRYVTGCAGCHGNDGRGGRVDEGVRDEDAGDIREAIHEEREMAYLACLPAADVESIAGFLNGTEVGGCGDGDDDCGDEEREKRRKCKRDDDCDADGRRDEEDDDDDNDQMPDDYEEAKGFNPYDPADARQDADRDGKSNLAEFRAGTDPLDATSTPGGSPSGGTGGTGHATLLGLLALLASRRRRVRPALCDG